MGRPLVVTVTIASRTYLPGPTNELNWGMTRNKRDLLSALAEFTVFGEILLKNSCQLVNFKHLMVPFRQLKREQNQRQQVCLRKLHEWDQGQLCFISFFGLNLLWICPELILASTILQKFTSKCWSGSIYSTCALALTFELCYFETSFCYISDPGLEILSSWRVAGLEFQFNSSESLSARAFPRTWGRKQIYKFTHLSPF